MSQTRGRGAFLVAEAILIVASILLAFAIDAWWEGQQEEGQRVELLRALHADLAATSGDLDDAIAQGDSLVNRSGGFLRAVRSETPIDADSLQFLFVGIADAPFFEPTLPSYRTAVATGTIELVRSAELVAALGDLDLAHEMYQLHLGVSADLFYLGPIQDLRRAGVSFDDPIAPSSGYWMSAPAAFDFHSTLATASAESMYTVQRNMLANLKDMLRATGEAVAEIEALLGA